MRNLIIAALLLASSVAVARDEKHREAGNTEKIEVYVTERGFEPSDIKVKPGKHVLLNVTRKTEVTCAKEIQVKSKKIKKDLPLNKTVSIDLGKIEKGDISFACGMNMIKGKVTAQ